MNEWKELTIDDLPDGFLSGIYEYREKGGSFVYDADMIGTKKRYIRNPVRTQG